MVCYDCWYAAKIIGESEENIECRNPKSDHFAKVVDRSFECLLFSDANLPDPEAEKIILDPELVVIVRRKKDEFTRARVA